MTAVLAQEDSELRKAPGNPQAPRAAARASSTEPPGCGRLLGDPGSCYRWLSLARPGVRFRLAVQLRRRAAAAADIGPAAATELSTVTDSDSDRVAGWHLHSRGRMECQPRRHPHCHGLVTRSSAAKQLPGHSLRVVTGTVRHGASDSDSPLGFLLCNKPFSSRMEASRFDSNFKVFS